MPTFSRCHCLRSLLGICILIRSCWNFLQVADDVNIAPFDQHNFDKAGKHPVLEKNDHRNNANDQRQEHLVQTYQRPNNHIVETKNHNINKHNRTCGGENHTWALDREYVVPDTPGAFIHVGKTGGTTMSTLLRNGCHSWVQKPCRELSASEESAMSILTTFYHVPDFQHVLPKHLDYKFYVFSIRDPLERLKSAFTFQHPYNVEARNAAREFPMSIDRPLFLPCFETLEAFAYHVGEDHSQFEYSAAKHQINNTNCTNLARAIMNEKIPSSGHFFWTLNRIRGIVAPKLNVSVVYVIRTEHLWEDWASTNQCLGQTINNNFDVDSITPPTKARLRDHSDVRLPVTKTSSNLARQYLCNALKPEYDAYLDLLRRAVNLDEYERQESLKIAMRNCPTLGLRL